MMDECIEVSLTRIESCVEALGRDEFLQLLKMTKVIQQLHPDGVSAHNTALQPTANPLRGLSAAELGR